MTKFISPVEGVSTLDTTEEAPLVTLSDVELDAVTGGLFNSNVGNTGVGNNTTGVVALSALGVGIGNVSVL